jgi:hypothetical protein
LNRGKLTWFLSRRKDYIFYVTPLPKMSTGRQVIYENAIYINLDSAGSAGA